MEHVLLAKQRGEKQNSCSADNINWWYKNSITLPVSVRLRCATKMEKWSHTSIIMQNIQYVTQQGPGEGISKSRRGVISHLLNLSPVMSLCISRLCHYIYTQRRLCSMWLINSWHLFTSIFFFPLLLGYAGNSCVLEGLKHTNVWTTRL